MVRECRGAVRQYRGAVRECRGAVRQCRGGDNALGRAHDCAVMPVVSMQCISAHPVHTLQSLRRFHSLFDQCQHSLRGGPDVRRHEGVVYGLETIVRIVRNEGDEQQAIMLVSDSVVADHALWPC